MRSTLKWVPVLVGLFLAATRTRGDEPGTLAGTKPLTMTGDIASALVDGVDRFLLKKTEESVARRPAFWKRDVSSPEAYTASVAPNRERLRQILGVRDPRVPFEAMELVGTTAQPALIARGQGYDVFAVRWPAFGDVHGEGLLLVPTGRKVADVVAIPDADQTPEQLVGLAEGIAPASQFARRLAEIGCRVVVPVLIDRKVAPRNGRARLTSREYLYRSAFEMGRHILGYEVQKVLAVVDWFVKDAHGSDPRIGVFGYGEGGLIALDAAAIDTRIDAVGVSGYLDRRQDLWREPIDRNVFGFLEEFGDAEVVSLVAPRPITVEIARGPELTIAAGTGSGAGPGRLTTPDPASVHAEMNRALALIDGLKPVGPSTLIDPAGGVFGTEAALNAWLRSFEAGVMVAADVGPPERLGRSGVDPEARQARQVHEIDRHNQQLLAESPYTRQAYFSKADTSSLPAFEKTIEPYRTAFRDEIIGRFDDPLLPADPRTRRIYDDPKFEGYEVVLDVFPDVIAEGILLVPRGIKSGERRPVVVCQHGLEGRPRELADPKVDSPFYHHFAATLAAEGFVTFAPQNLYIFGDRFRSLQRKANPLKKTLFSVIVPQHQQITDWLRTLPFVDPARIGFYGLSYGGKTAMRVPPLVSNYALSICSGDFNEWVGKNASTRSPYSYVWTPEYEIFEWNLGNTFNYSEMAALIAPRPFLVERGHFDTVGSDDAVGGEFARVRLLYEGKLGIGDRAEIEWFSGPHTIHGVGSFAFLRKHLNWPAATRAK